MEAEKRGPTSPSASALTSAASTSITPLASSSRLPPLPRRSIEDAANSIALLVDPLSELCPSLHSIQSLCLLSVESLPGHNESFRKERLEKAILRAASNGDVELLSWICYVRSRRSSGYKVPEAKAMEGIDWDDLKDEEGSGPLNLAAQSGHADIVQLLVQYGADVDERDALGWTPLMWATNSSNLPLVSFLLSHGADIEARSSKGATCEAFVLSCTPQVRLSSSVEADASKKASQVPSSPQSTDRQLIADLIFEHQQAVLKDRAEATSKKQRHRLRAMSNSSSLESEGENSTTHSSQLGPSTIASSHPSLHSKSSSRTLRRLIGKQERTMIEEADVRAGKLAEGRKSALLEVAVMMQVNYADLVGEAPTASNEVDDVNTNKHRDRRKRSSESRDKPVHSGLASGCGAIEVGMDPLSVEFDFDVVRPDQMLVVGQSQVSALLDCLIREARPVRAPWVARSKCANVLFLCIRYACSLPDENLLEDLIFGAVDRIEAVLYAHPTKLTYLAFWLYNGMLLLHYVQRDRTLQQSESMQDYQALLAELINEIYVFIIRDVERRIDAVLDAAILEHQSISGFQDIRFEGEWNFIKTLTGSVKRANQAQSSSPSKRPLSQFFSSDSSPSSPPPNAHRRTVSSIFSTPTAPKIASLQDDVKGSFQDVSASGLLAKPLPRTITLLLTSTLHILQLYEVNPSVIVQALSQIFYWVGCELFNRVISQRKYLCKSKAMQIRLNISALEDWVKTNALPLSIVNQHLSKLNQLISWLLSHSSLVNFDDLIATLQGLKHLNPSQLKEAVRNYRYEVGETKISEECLDYLDQLQMDWEKRYEQDFRERIREGHVRMGIAQPANGNLEKSLEDESSLAMKVQEQQMPSTDGTMRGVVLQRQESEVSEGIRASHGRDGTATPNHPNGSQSGDDEDKSSVSGRKTPEGQASTSEDMKNSKDLPQTPNQSVQQLPIGKQEAKDIAERTQLAIDLLFEAGQSMINYVPPTSSQLKAGTSTLLNSREMLPFALPSQTQALVVSPGDAFGFGRGHFMGTGAPSLKSLRGNNSLLEGVAVRDDEGGGNTINSTPSLSSEASSRGSSSRLSQISGSSRLYPQGKGLSAGSYWQPVPILPDDTLEEIEDLMKRLEQRRKFHTGTDSSNIRQQRDRRLSSESRLSRSRSSTIHQSPNTSISPKSTRSIDQTTQSTSLSM